MDEKPFLIINLSSEQHKRLKNLLHGPQESVILDQNLRDLKLAYLHHGRTYSTKLGRMLFDINYNQLILQIISQMDTPRSANNDPVDLLTASKFNKNRLFNTIRYTAGKYYGH